MEWKAQVKQRRTKEVWRGTILAFNLDLYLPTRYTRRDDLTRSKLEEQLHIGLREHNLESERKTAYDLVRWVPSSIHERCKSAVYIMIRAQKNLAYVHTNSDFK